MPIDSARAALPAAAVFSALTTFGLAVTGPVAAADPSARAANAEAYEPVRGPTGDAVPSASNRKRVNAYRAWQAVGDRAVIEGDMIVGSVDARGELVGRLQTRGLGHSRTLGRWPDGIVPWAFADDIDEDRRATILAAIRHWIEKTRISFVERDASNAADHGSWIVFRPTGGCASSVGRTDQQPQDLFVQSCTVGSVVHEIGHAVGLYHEHTRPDRDMWITVDEDQIVPPAPGDRDKARNFEIMRTNSQELGPYDYDSIMHYGSHFFARGDEPTIVAPPGENIGQRLALSSGDIRAANAMYATDLAVAVVANAFGDTAEVDVTVDNLGGLGAHDLEMVLELEEGARWTAVTEDSGWDCLSDGPQLLCRRATLPETAPQSRFILEATPNGTSLERLKVRLASRTLDLNPANNVINDEVPGLAAAEPAADEARADEGRGDAPGLDGAPAGSQRVASIDPAPTAARASPAGGAKGGSAGGASGPLALLALAGLVRRRRTVARPA